MPLLSRAVAHWPSIGKAARAVAVKLVPVELLLLTVSLQLPLKVRFGAPHLVET